MKKNKHHIDRNTKNNKEYNIIELPQKFHAGIHRYVGFGKSRKPMPSRYLINEGLSYCQKHNIKLNTQAWTKFMEYKEHNYIGIYS